MSSGDQGIQKKSGGRFQKVQAGDPSNAPTPQDDDMEFEADPFIDTGNYKADFASFMMNTMIYKLTRVLGFDTVLLMSKDGENLYLLIRAEEKDLKKLAHQQEF